MIIEYRLFKTSPFMFILRSFVGKARTLGGRGLCSDSVTLSRRHSGLVLRRHHVHTAVTCVCSSRWLVGRTRQTSHFIRWHTDCVVSSERFRDSGKLRSFRATASAGSCTPEGGAGAVTRQARGFACVSPGRRCSERRGTQTCGFVFKTLPGGAVRWAPGLAGMLSLSLRVTVTPSLISSAGSVWTPPLSAADRPHPVTKVARAVGAHAWWRAVGDRPPAAAGIGWAGTAWGNSPPDTACPGGAHPPTQPLPTPPCPPPLGGDGQASAGGQGPLVETAWVVC